MPIAFPSPPIANASSSGYLSQPDPITFDDSTPLNRSSSTLVDRLTAPWSQPSYDHLWSSPSDHLKPASSPTTTQNPPPSSNNPPVQSSSELDRAIQTLQGNYRELQHANRSELSQTRTAVERRMDDLAEAMHNDMRRLQDQTLSEAATIHSDVFRCATKLGHVQDRLSRLESAFNSLQDALRSMHPAFASALPDMLPLPQTPIAPNPMNRPPPVALVH